MSSLRFDHTICGNPDGPDSRSYEKDRAQKVERENDRVEIGRRDAFPAGLTRRNFAGIRIK